VPRQTAWVEWGEGGKKKGKRKGDENGLEVYRKGNEIGKLKKTKVYTAWEDNEGGKEEWLVQIFTYHPDKTPGTQR